MSSRSCGAVATALACLLGASSAHADDAPSPESPADRPSEPSRSKRLHGLGETGQVVLGDALGGTTTSGTGVPTIGGAGTLGATPMVTASWVSFGTSSFTFPDGRSSTGTTIKIEPSLDVFVGHGFSLGGSGGLAMSRIRAAGADALHVNVATFSPRIGYLVPLTDDLALWPRLRFAVSKTTLGDNAGVADPPAAWGFGANIPVVVSISRHALLEVGPDIAYVHAENADGTVAKTVRAGARGSLSLAF
jgi:hypothetical protein